VKVSDFIDVVHAMAEDVNASARTVRLAGGRTLNYDKLVLSPGIDIRWGGGDPERIRAQAAEAVGLAPDAILTNTTPPTRAAQQATRTGRNVRRPAVFDL
jgi:NADPH-dependent 2,4-dienoyl-CoA reductase/sulfur reductase-like enzyme